MERLQLIVMGMSLFLNFTSICAILYAFYKFINKPRTDLETRVTECEVKIKEFDSSLKQGNDRFREQAKTNRAIFNVFLAFIDFEIAYCHSTGYKDNEDLIKAKDAINSYLTDFE